MSIGDEKKGWRNVAFLSLSLERTEASGELSVLILSAINIYNLEQNKLCGFYICSGPATRRCIDFLKIH